MERYRGRISGSLLDRIDLYVEVPALSLDDLRKQPSETNQQVARRVLAARKRQSSRFPAFFDDR